MAHPNAVKAKVISALLLGMGVSEAAEKFKVPQPTVSHWNAALAEKVNETELYSQDYFQGLVARTLDSQLQALQKIADAVRSDEYIRNQSAADLGVLYREIATPALHILGAAERAANAQRQLAAASED